jgi:adenylate cyclase
MSSIIEGYNYDIFISYRQKDNKGDRWVSEFVEALKTELESTFKEEISVYFDINPHDGLLETHDVDASLKDKLKCLVFIPIISRTYCDPKSFAWVHEFKAFVEQASKDQFGLKVKLPNGNVANRVLPIRIYDLDVSDKKLCESELGSVLRGIEFIYKSAGVNRPLRSKEENPQENLNHTLYRDQINKVANTIKEIFTAIGQFGQQPKEVSKEFIKPASVPLKSNKSKIIVGLVIVLLLVLLAYLLIPKFLKPKEQLEKSIAVLPFRNDSPNDSTTYFMNGVMEEILNNLQKINDFNRVLSRNSVEQFRNNTTKSIPEIAKKLNVNYIVEGSGQKYGNTFRLRVQLIVAKNEKHLWGESFEQEIQSTKDIFRIQSQVAQAIASKLEATITPLEKQLIEKTPTDNLEAYRLYMQGNSLMFQQTEDAYRKAIDTYHQSVALDSGFAQAYAGLAFAYLELGGWMVTSPSSEYIPQARKWALKTLEINKNLAETYFVLGSIKYLYEWDWIGAEQDFKKGMELNPNFVWGRIYYANFLTAMGRFEESIRIGEQTLKLSPLDPGVNAELGFALFFDGQNEKALELYNKSLELNPNFDQTLCVMAMLYAREGQYDQSISIWKRELILFNNEIRKIPAFDLAIAGQVFGLAGRRDEALTLLHELNRRAKEEGYMHTSYMAFIYIGLGENQKALELLGKSFNDKDFVLVWLKVHSMLDPLRSNEHFKQLLRKMRYPE